jgi:dipeptidyl aminopeptidase/acylaminoacyl peptidase
MRAAHMKAVECYRDGVAHARPPGERIELQYQNKKIYGVLRKPNVSNNPVLIMAPGLDSTKEEIHAYEEPFLARGIAVLAIDGPGQGEAEYEIPICGDYERAATAVVDWIETRDDLNNKKIAIWGVSLGGYYAPRLASGVEQVRACVALAGPYNFGECWDQLPPLTRTAFTARSFSADQEAGRKAALQLDLTHAAGKIRVPLLVVAGKQDRLIPWQHAERLVAEAGGPTELIMLEDGNHGNMNVAAKHRYKTADWMARQLQA